MPKLLLILASIYLGLGLLACLLITQPPDDWLEKTTEEETTKKEDETMAEYVTPCEALQRREFWCLWITRHVSSSTKPR